MTVEIIDGVRILKLHDASGTSVDQAAADRMTMVHLWRLLSGAHDLRDMTPGDRHYL